MRSAAYAATVSVVVNGSVGLSVIGVWPLGSGSLMMSSSRWFCQKHRISAATNANTAITMRVRSSSRWSTTVRRSSWPTGRCLRSTGVRPGGPALRGVRCLGAVGGGGLVGRGRGHALGGVRRGRGEAGHLVIVVLAVAGHGVLELAHAAAERTTELRQALRPEDHEHDQQDDCNLWQTDAGHGSSPVGTTHR